LFVSNRATGEMVETPAEARERLAHMNQPIEKEACLDEEHVADTIEEIDFLVSQNRATLQNNPHNESPMNNRAALQIDFLVFVGIAKV
jgi:hypothetical protein